MQKGGEDKNNDCDKRNFIGFSIHRRFDFSVPKEKFCVFLPWTFPVLWLCPITNTKISNISIKGIDLGSDSDNHFFLANLCGYKEKI